MSTSIMAQVWPLDLPPTDKSVLLALADSANDHDDGKTWIPITSRQAVSRSGRLKLSLTVKTRYGETAIREAIKRLVKAGHITREEKPGLGVTYWVHPVADPTPSSGEGVREASPSAREPTPSGGEAPPLTSRGENQRNQNKPSAGARASREARPPAGPLGGPATAEHHLSESVIERDAEGEREAKVRAAVLVAARGSPRWLERCGLKCGPILSDDGPFGLDVYFAPGDRPAIEGVQGALERTAAEAVGLPCRWVSIREGTRRG